MITYYCIACSTEKQKVIVKPILEEGFLTCPECGSIELEKRKN